MGWRKGSMVLVAVTLIVGLLAGATGALAGDLKTTFSVPSQVVIGIPFAITVNVTNNNPPGSGTIQFNKVAAGYARSDLKVFGPYEVYTTLVPVAPGETKSFSFPFTIGCGKGTIVPVAVIFALNSYDNQNLKGGGMLGIMVN